MYTYLPIIMLMILAGVTAFVFVIANRIFGPRSLTSTKLDPFECGVEVNGGTRQPFFARFYLIALMFVLFDVEAVFFYPWAVVFRKLGLFAGVEMALFMLFLAGALAYAWKKGGLEWE